MDWFLYDSASILKELKEMEWEFKINHSIYLSDNASSLNWGFGATLIFVV